MQKTKHFNFLVPFPLLNVLKWSVASKKSCEVPKAAQECRSFSLSPSRSSKQQENIGIGSLLARYNLHFVLFVVHVYVFVSMVVEGTIGNKFWIMAQPSAHQGQHWPIVLLRQDEDDSGCLLVDSRISQNHFIHLKLLLGRVSMSALALYVHLSPGSFGQFVSFLGSCWLCAMFPGNLKEIPYVADDKFLTLHSGVGGCGP